jgi:hypothetical protein
VNADAEVKRDHQIRSRGQCDFSGPLKPVDRLALPPIRHASVDEARLDVSMTKVILYEVDRLAGVEKVGCAAVPETMHVPPIRREIAEGGVAREDGLDPTLAQAPLATDEERRIVIGPSAEVAPDNRPETPKERLLPGVAVLHSPDPDRPALEIDVFSL